MRGKRVAQRVHGSLRVHHRPFFFFLREHFLRAPLAVLPAIRPFKQPFYGLVQINVGLQQFPHLRRQQRTAVFLAFPVAHEKAVLLRLEVFQPKADCLAEPQPGGVDQHQQATVLQVVHRPQQCLYFLLQEHFRQLLRLFWLEQVLHLVPLLDDAAVEHLDGAHHLALVRGAALFVAHKVRKVFVDVLPGQLGRLRVVIKTDKFSEAVLVALNGAPTVPLQGQALLKGGHGSLVAGGLGLLRPPLWGGSVTAVQPLRHALVRLKVPAEHAVEILPQKTQGQACVWHFPPHPALVPAAAEVLHGLLGGGETEKGIGLVAVFLQQLGDVGRFGLGGGQVRPVAAVQGAVGVGEAAAAGVG